MRWGAAVSIALCAVSGVARSDDAGIKPYWVHQDGEIACGTLKDFSDAWRLQGPLATDKDKARVERAYLGTGRCDRLKRTDIIAWDGKELPVKSGEAIPAKVRIEGKAGDWFLAARSLNRQSWADLNNEEFTAAREVLACAVKSSIQDGYRALSMGDAEWLERLGCISIPTGWRVLRLDPALGYWGYDWRMRVYAPSGKGVTVFAWITEGDLSAAPKEAP